MLVRRIVIAAICGVAVAGCGATASPGDRQSVPPPSGLMNDPALDAAANSLTDLETTFPDTYAGLELKQEDRAMVVYRLPDPKLDEVVRSRTQGVTVHLRDAKFPLKHMRTLTDQIMNDRDYWLGQGIRVNGAGPKVDGSSVEVMTSKGDPAEARALAARYGQDTVTVRAATPVVPTLTLPTPFTPPTR